MSYDDDPRYEFVEEGVYFDTQTNETVFVFDDETADMFRKVFDIKEDQDEYKMTESDWRKILGDKFNKTEYDDIFNSDLNEL